MPPSTDTSPIAATAFIGSDPNTKECVACFTRRMVNSSTSTSAGDRGGSRFRLPDW